MATKRYGYVDNEVEMLPTRNPLTGEVLVYDTKTEKKFILMAACFWGDEPGAYRPQINRDRERRGGPVIREWRFPEHLPSSADAMHAAYRAIPDWCASRGYRVLKSGGAPRVPSRT